MSLTNNNSILKSLFFLMRHQYGKNSFYFFNYFSELYELHIPNDNSQETYIQGNLAIQNNTNRK